MHLLIWSFAHGRARSTARQEVLCSPGSPATVSRACAGRRPAALRPTLSRGLPLSGCYQSIRAKGIPKRREWMPALSDPRQCCDRAVTLGHAPEDQAVKNLRTGQRMPVLIQLRSIGPAKTWLRDVAGNLGLCFPCDVCWSGLSHRWARRRRLSGGHDPV
jgi:hypothetical protein